MALPKGMLEFTHQFQVTTKPKVLPIFSKLYLNQRKKNYINSSDKSGKIKKTKSPVRNRRWLNGIKISSNECRSRCGKYSYGFVRHDRRHRGYGR